MYAWLSTLSGTPWMFASIGTLAIAGRTALSTGYVATEIIISHHNLYIWLRQTNKQRNKYESCFVSSTPFDTDKLWQLSSENVTVQAIIPTPHTSNQHHEAVLPETWRFLQVEREPLPIMEPKGSKHPSTSSSHKPHSSNPTIKCHQNILLSSQPLNTLQKVMTNCPSPYHKGIPGGERYISIYSQPSATVGV